MYPEMLYDNELPKDPVTFDVYPHGSSSFEMYEDDGLSREHRNGAYAKTIIGCVGPDFGNSGTVSIFVGESVGEYEGKPESRAYRFEVHVHGPPEIVKIDLSDIKIFSTRFQPLLLQIRDLPCWRLLLIFESRASVFLAKPG